MNLPFQKWLHLLSILALAGVGAYAIYFSAQSRQTKAAVMPTLTATPTPITIQVDLPALAPVPEVQGVSRAAQLHTYHPEIPRFAIREYVVQEGDSAFSISKQFELKPETLLWGNPGMNPDAGMLKVGAKLNILPVDGVLHIVKEGDTLQKLQDLHGVSVKEIIDFIGNDFKGDMPDRLVAGQRVIIPGGRNQATWVEPAGPTVTSVNGGSVSNPLAYLYKGYFQWPVFPVLVTQPFWSAHGGIDIGLLYRQPVFAAAGGTVVFADWDTTGFGNLVIIDHGNGILTYYGHNYALLVRYGQAVGRGQQIAEGGSTGNSTGPHVDFRIKVSRGGYVNPADYLP